MVFSKQNILHSYDKIATQFKNYIYIYIYTYIAHSKAKQTLHAYKILI